MAKKRTGLIKVLQTVGILCVFTLGLVSIIGTGADDVADVVDLPPVTVEDVELPLPAINVDSVTVAGGPILREARDYSSSCPTTSINTLINSADWTAIESEYGVSRDDVDIDGFVLDSVEISYSNASWTGGTPTIECTIDIYEDEGATEYHIYEEVIAQGSSTPTAVTLSTETQAAIANYCNNRDTVFSYCASCEATGAVTSFSADWNVVITGDLTVDP